MATYEQQPSYGANQHLMGGQPGPQSSYQSGPGQYGAGGFQQGAVPVYQAGFCNHAMLDESFTCCGIATAVLCFPCGLICWYVIVSWSKFGAKIAIFVPF
jgi:hypothetical protein